MRYLIIIFILSISTYANDVTSSMFVVQKDFDTTKKIIETELLKGDCSFKQRDSKIFEIYFDSPEMVYLKNSGYIRYKATQYLSKKKKVKYKEIVEYSSDDNLSYEFPVKHYKSVKSIEEKHPLLTIIKRKERQGFILRLQNDGIKYPMRLKNILEVSKQQHSFILSSNSTDFANININKATVSAVGSKVEFIYLKVFIDNTKLQIVPPSSRTKILDSIDNLKKEFGIKNENIVSNEYLISFEQMEKNIDLFYWILRYPYLINLLYSLGLGVLGVVLIFILFRKRLCYNI